MCKFIFAEKICSLWVDFFFFFIITPKKGVVPAKLSLPLIVNYELKHIHDPQLINPDTLAVPHAHQAKETNFPQSKKNVILSVKYLKRMTFFHGSLTF